MAEKRNNGDRPAGGLDLIAGKGNGDGYVRSPACSVYSRQGNVLNLRFHKDEGGDFDIRYSFSKSRLASPGGMDELNDDNWAAAQVMEHAVTGKGEFAVVCIEVQAPGTYAFYARRVKGKIKSHIGFCGIYHF